MELNQISVPVTYRNWLALVTKQVAISNTTMPDIFIIYSLCNKHEIEAITKCIMIESRTSQVCHRY